ncbi:MAG: esterase-like activity of phytase family protein [Bacteroidota bacterium]
MRAPLILIFIGLLFGGLASAQSPNCTAETITLPPKLDEGWGISGLIHDGAQFYMIAERRGIIFGLTPQGEDLHTWDISDQLPRKYELEAITLYRDRFFFTDESKRGKGRIFYSNRAFSHVRRVKVDRKLRKLTGSTGMEGIAFNAAAQRCYLVREKNGEGASEIYSFSVTTDENGQVRFHFLNRTTLPHPDPKLRVPDVYYDATVNRLYAIRARRGVYQITYLTPDPDSGALPERAELNVLCTIDEADMDGYASNLEGIFVAGNTVYLVSDNQYGRTYQGKTGFFRTELPE